MQITSGTALSNIYECSVCVLRTRLLKDIKSHIVIEHDETKLLYHMKMKRNEHDIVDFKSYKICEVLKKMSAVKTKEIFVKFVLVRFLRRGLLISFL